MDISEIITAYKAYYKNGGQGIKDLYQMVRRPLMSEKLFRVIITDDTIWQGSRVQYGRLVQAYQKGFTPINPGKFTPVEIRMFHQKMDTVETPHELEESWLGFLTGDDVAPKNWPFVKWWIETQIIPQIQEDIEIYEIGKGVRVNPTAGTAGAAGASMDGFLTIIKAHITATRTTPIAMGAIPADDLDLVNYFEDFADQINKKYWKRPMTVAVNEDLERRYLRGKLEKYGTKTRGDVLIDNSIEFSKLTIEGFPSMEGSNRIWCSPADNCVTLKKKTQNERVFDIQPADREVKLLSDWYRGVGFILPELIFCNDLV